MLESYSYKNTKGYWYLPCLQPCNFMSSVDPTYYIVYPSLCAKLSFGGGGGRGTVGSASDSKSMDACQS